MRERQINAGDLRRLNDFGRRLVLVYWSVLIWWEWYTALPKPLKMAVDTGLYTWLVLLCIPFDRTLSKSVPVLGWLSAYLVALIGNLIFPRSKELHYHWVHGSRGQDGDEAS